METEEALPQQPDPASGRAWEEGREAGYGQGHEAGYRLGLCDAALRGLTQEEEEPVRDIHVLYVTAGIGVPYPALDQAVITALRGLVRRLSVAAPADDVAAIARSGRPDLVLVLNGVKLSAAKVERLRKDGFATAVWFTDDPYYTDWTRKIAPRYDYVFTLERNCLPFYRKLGCRQVHYVPFASDPAIFRPKPVPAAYRSDICFIGTAFWNRVDLIDRLAPALMDRKALIAGWWWDRLQNYPLLSRHIRLGDWMTPEETASCYNGAKIVINLHRSVDDETINYNRDKLKAHSVNPRMFEIAGCATLQLCDARQEARSLYAPGREIETFASHDELIAKIDYYLRHEEERRRIALNGLLRTRREHTYRKRLSALLNAVFPQLPVEIG